MERVIVVGAGVIGLSCAVRLLEAGHDVHVLARDLPLETTSAVSAALWFPYRAAPPEHVSRWARRSFTEFVTLADSAPDAGVDLRPGVELLRSAARDPEWAGDVLDYRRDDDVPGPYSTSRRFVSPVADMPVYLQWLRRRVTELGGTITRMVLAHLPTRERGVVVDAAGLGARGLARDTTVSPTRGQVVLLEQVGVTRWVVDGAAPTYVVPRRSTVVVGGTAEEGEWSTRPDSALVPELIERRRPPPTDR